MFRFLRKLKNKFKKRALKDARFLYKPHLAKKHAKNHLDLVKTTDDLLNAIIQTRIEVINKHLYEIYYLLRTPLTKERDIKNLDNTFLYLGQDIPKTYIYSHEEVYHKGKTFKETVVDTGVLASFFGQFGDFNVPTRVIDGIIEARKNDQVHDTTIDSIPESRYKGAKEVFELLKENTDINEYALYGIIGAMYVECGWNFEDTIYNKDEQGGNGVAGTNGFAGCGECWFGLTFWKQKEKVIFEIDAPSHIPRNETAYNNGTTSTILASLDKSWQCKIINAYLKKCAKKQYDILSKEIKDISSLSDEEMEEQLAASYLWKAGQGKDATLEDACEISETYMRTHEKQGHKNVKHGFYTQIFVAIAFALYLDEDKVYKAKEIDELL